MRRIELSCDLGEASTPEEEEVEAILWTLIDAANVACGGHAGDERSMRDAARTAARLGTILGAHPSYPDREGFGRRKMAISGEDLRRSITEQISSLQEIAGGEGVAIARVKPHGALYNEAHQDRELAALIVEAVQAVGEHLAIVAAPGSALIEAARKAGMAVVREAFIDRRYRGDGSLVPRSREGALLIDGDESVNQALRLVERGEVVTDAGEPFRIEFDTLVLHGDTPGAVARARRVRGALGMVR